MSRNTFNSIQNSKTSNANANSIVNSTNTSKNSIKNSKPNTANNTNTQRNNSSSCSVFLTDNVTQNASNTEFQSYSKSLAKAYTLRRQVQANEVTQRKVHVYHFTCEHSGLQSIDSEEIMYENVLCEAARDALPVIFYASMEPNRSFGRTLIVCSFGTTNLAVDYSLTFYDILEEFQDANPEVSLYHITIYNAVEYPIAYIGKYNTKTAVRKVVNVIMHDDKDSLDFMLAEGNKGEVRLQNSRKSLNMIRLPQDEILAHDDSIYGQWWYRLFNKVPLCADGRLIQTQGTCWWNASANMLMLTDTIAALLKLTWSTLPSKYQDCIGQIGLDSCPNRNISPTDFMYVLINQIVIQGSRALDKEVDFSSDAAGLFYNVTTKHRKAMNASYQVTKKQTSAANAYKLLQVDGGNSMHSFEVFMKTLLKVGRHYNILFSPHETVDKDNPHFKYDIEPNIIEDRFVVMPEFLHLWREFPYPQILILNTAFPPSRGLPSEISVNRHMYDLEAASMMMQSEKFSDHVVAGLTCHNASKSTRYIFDSNNIIAINDWATLVQGEDEKNTKRLKAYNKASLTVFPHGRVCTFCYFRFALYTFRHT